MKSEFRKKLKFKDKKSSFSISSISIEIMTNRQMWRFTKMTMTYLTTIQFLKKTVKKKLHLRRKKRVGI